jgi:ABC-2 type transport system permease protein
MSKLWLVALNEYKRNVFKKSFILALLSVPLMVGFTVGLGLIMTSLEDNDAPVGYVDHAGFLRNPLPAPLDRSDKPIEFIPYKTESEARQALEAEEIQAYYELASDFGETSQIGLFYLKEPGRNATQQFYDFIQINLLWEHPPEIARRATVRSEVTIRSPDGSLEFPAGGPALGNFLPMLIGVAFVFLLMMSSGYLMAGVVEEKENRVMEVLVTSISPPQLIAGKVLGIVAISLTQLAAWILVGILAVIVGGDVLGIEWFQNPSINWGTIFNMIAIAVPAYVLASALMFALGATVAEAQEGQSLGAIFFMLHMIPLYLLVILIENPNGTISIMLSLLPFTSILTVGFRSMFAVIPMWQIALSVVIQTLCALGALWLAAFVFRLGMLRYGQRLKLAEIIRNRSTAITKASLS